MVAVILMCFITADEALKEALGETDLTERSAKFFKACLLLFKSSMFNDAMKYFSEINDAELFVNLATDDYVNSKLFEMGRIQQLKKLLYDALEKLGYIKDPKAKIQWALRIADSLFKIGLVHESSRIIGFTLKQIESLPADEIDDLLCSLAEIQSKISNYQEARKTASKIRRSEKKSLALLYIVKAFTFRGQIDEAVLTASEITDPVQKSNAYTYIAAALIKNRNIHEAKLIAALITIPAWKQKIDHWIKAYT